MSQEAMATGIGALLTASQISGSFYDDVGGRIYEGLAPEDAALPLAVWNVVTDPPDGTFTGDNVDAEFQLDVYGEARLGMAALGAINDKAFAVLQNQRPTIAGYEGTVIQCLERGQRTREESAYRIMSRWKLMANPT